MGEILKYLLFNKLIITLLILQALEKYNKAIDLLVQKDSRQENEDVRCGYSTLISNLKVSP